MARNPAYLGLLAALCALPPLSIDMGLPGLPAIGAAFGTDTGVAAMSVSLFMAGFALTPICYGMLSDRYGRRPLLLVGLALFALGGIGCALAPSIGWLLVARLIQGAGAGSGPTLAFAATRDRLDGARLGRRLAMLTMLLNTAPVIAPSLGTAFLAWAGWRGVYIVLALGGGLLLAAAVGGFGETLAPREANATRPSLLATLARDGGVLLRRPAALLSGAIYGLSAGAMFAYVSASPLLLMKGLGVSPALYAGLFAITAGGIVLGAFLSGRVLNRMSTAPVLAIGNLLLIAGPGCAVALLLAGDVSLPQIIACMVVATFGYGLTAPAAAHATLEPVPEITGTTAAIMNSFQMACMSLSSFIVSAAFAHIGNPAVPVIMAGFAVLSSVCFLARQLQTALADRASGARDVQAIGVGRPILSSDIRH